jgi:hypothetical protein
VNPESLRRLSSEGRGVIHKWAESWIEKWTVDTGRMTMTFYDTAGREMLVEQIK